MWCFLMEIIKEVLPWLFAAVALCGTIANSRRNKWGFLAWIASNLWMSISSIMAGLMAQGVLFFIYLILAIYGLVKWTRIESESDGDK